MRHGHSIQAVVLALFVGACAPAAVPSAAPTVTLGPVSPSPVAAATAAPTAASQAPVATQPSVPAGLIGKWQATISADATAVLEIRAQAYSITRDNVVSGRLELDGASLAFSHATLCDGVGTYAWTLTDDTLHLDVIGTDPCPFRVASLDGVTYTRVK